MVTGVQTCALPISCRSLPRTSSSATRRITSTNEIPTSPPSTSILTFARTPTLTLLPLPLIARHLTASATPLALPPDPLARPPSPPPLPLNPKVTRRIRRTRPRPETNHPRRAGVRSTLSPLRRGRRGSEGATRSIRGSMRDLRKRERLQGRVWTRRWRSFRRRRSGGSRRSSRMLLRAYFSFVVKR